MRGIVGTPAPFFHHHLDFLVEFLFRHQQVVHTVGFQLHRQRQPGLVQHLEIGGVIVAGKSVLATAGGGNTLRKFTCRYAARTLEHHMLQRMGNAGLAGPFIHTANVVPHLLHNHRRAMIFLDYHLETVA